MAASLFICSLVSFITVTTVLLLMVQNTDAIRCYACNSYFQGRTHLCEEHWNRTGCVACLKTVTKIKLRDSGYIMGWERVSATESKYCAFQRNSQGLREEGCYYQQNNGGYTERCYCYTDLCNKAGPSTHSASSWIYAVTSLAVAVVSLRR